MGKRYKAPENTCQAVSGAVESWLRGELPQTPEEMTRRIGVMFQDPIRGAALRLKTPAARP